MPGPSAPCAWLALVNRPENAADETAVSLAVGSPSVSASCVVSNTAASAAA